MAGHEPVVGWLHAYPPLPILASSAMAQPAGRLLSVGAINSVWLRVSPLLCALDALALLLRCLVYCVALRATPRQALLLIGSDRFGDPEIETDTLTTATTAATIIAAPEADAERGTTARIAAIAMTVTTTAIRLAGFGLGLVPLVELEFFEPGGHAARWTAAWAWMFAGSYIILEVAAQVYQWEQAQPQYTPADFELEDMTRLELEEMMGLEPSSSSGHDDDDNESATSREGGEATSKPADETGSTEEEDRDQEDAEHEETDDLLAGNASASRTDTASTAPLVATTTQPAPSTTNNGDLEAGNSNSNGKAHHPYEYNNNPASHPRLPAVNTVLTRVDRCFLTAGCIAHAVLLYWAFLDLVQPPINVHILAVDKHGRDGSWTIVSNWETPLYFLSLPFTFVCLFLALFASLGVGAAVLGIFVGIAQLVNEQLPQSVKQWARGTVPAVVTLFLYGLGGLGLLISFFALSPMVGGLLLSAHMVWVYEMLSLEIVLFVLFCGACFVLYLVLKAGSKAASAKYKDADGNIDISRIDGATSIRPFKQNLLRYATDDGAALLAIVLITLVLSLVWYALRFAGSAHWAQHWRDTLIANVTANGTATNGTTMANGTAMANMTASNAAPSATLVQLSFER